MPSEDVAVMEQIMPLADWRKISSTNKYLADNISREYGLIGMNVHKLEDPSIAKDIIILNAKWLIRYPHEYLTSILDISSIIWQIGRPDDGYEWPPIEGGASDFEYGNHSIVKSVANSITTGLANFSYHTPILRSVFYRGGLWLYLLAFSFMLLINKKLYAYLIVLIVPIANSCLLFISIPAQDTRFILYLIDCVPYIFVFSVIVPSKNAPNIKRPCCVDNDQPE